MANRTVRKKKRSRVTRKATIRNHIVFLLVTTIAAIALSSIFIFPSFQTTNQKWDKRAIWISYLDLNPLIANNETTFQAKFEDMCQTTKDNNIDTLIVHVRAFQDAYYQSERYPSPFYGNQNLDYDPLKIMCEAAHRNHLKIEAWVNPYRISYQEEQYTWFYQHVIETGYLKEEDVIKNGGEAILDPESESARNFILAGIKEIIDHYDVDGIHFDDYFYTDGMMNHTTENQRKQNVNQLITKTYQIIKEKDTRFTFGISPQGNPENALYYGAAIDEWLSEEGYVDYVMPQIYWSDQYGKDGTIMMFSNRVDFYTKLHTNPKVKLYAGLALYLCGYEVINDIGWESKNDNLKQQVEILKKKKWNGYALFDYGSMVNEKSKIELYNLNH